MFSRIVEKEFWIIDRRGFVIVSGV